MGGNTYPMAQQSHHTSAPNAATSSLGRAQNAPRYQQLTPGTPPYAPQQGAYTQPQPHMQAPQVHHHQAPPRQQEQFQPRQQQQQHQQYSQQQFEAQQRSQAMPLQPGVQMPSRGAVP